MSAPSIPPHGKVTAIKVAPLSPWPVPAEPAYQVVELPPPGAPLAEPHDPGPLCYHLVAEPVTEDAVATRQRQFKQAGLDKLLKPRRQRPLAPFRWRREKHWHECLAFPARAGAPLLRFSLLLALASTWLIRLVPVVVDADLADLPAVLALALVPLLLLAYGCTYLQGMLDSAVAGDTSPVAAPALQDFPQVLATMARWLYGGATGPLWLAGAAVLYWVHAGTLTSLDQLILAELTGLTVGAWFFALVAATHSSRLRDANPLQALELAYHLGYPALAALLAASGLAYLHGCLALLALEQVHQGVFAGWLLFALWWLSALACTATLFRVVGLWCFRNVGLRPLPELRSF